MSNIGHEGNERWLFSQTSGQDNSPLFYRELPHFRAILRKLFTPLVILIAPIVLVICFDNIGRIISNWVITDTSYVQERILTAQQRFNDWFGQFGDLSWIAQLGITLWVIIVIFLITKAYYDWTHTFHSISMQYVIEAQKRLLQEERSLTIEVGVVVGASVRRTFIDKFFPVCGSVIVQTIDLEGEKQRILFQDVKDPYRMREVILKVKQEIKTSEGR